MRQYEQKFVNPLLAMAFKHGVDFVDDPEMRALTPKKATDGSTDWIVVVEDTSDLDDDDEEYEGRKPVIIDIPAKTQLRLVGHKPTFEEFKTATRGNMTPKAAKREPAATIIPTIAEPRIKVPEVSIKARRVIIPDVDVEAMGMCGKCINCKTGQDCIEKINAACSNMAGRER